MTTQFKTGQIVEINRRLVNQALSLHRDEPIFDEEIHSTSGYPWRCDIWQTDGAGDLFATAWGRSRIEAMSKANSILQACREDRWVES